MKSHSDTQIVIADTPVHVTLSDQLTDVVDRMVARHRRELDGFRRLPAEAMREDITSISRDVVSYYVTWLRDDSAPTEDQLARISRSAGRRAEEGVSLEALIAAYTSGLEGIFQRLTANAGAEDMAAVLALSERIFEFLRATTCAVAAGYLSEVRTTVSQDHNTRRALLAALLQGAPFQEMARASGIGLPTSYLLLNLSIGHHPDEQEIGVNQTVVTRRMLRRLLAVFESATDDQALTSLEATGGVILIPALPTVDWAVWSAVISDAARAAGATVTAAAAVTAPSSVAAAAKETSEVLEVLRWFDRTPGLYRLDDVLTEYLLTRPSAAREQLAALLDPLVAHPELFETLTQYLSGEVNRRHIANALHIHPNTVDYRLRRITELTGIDVTQPPGIHRVTAALAARRARDAS